MSKSANLQICEYANLQICMPIYKGRSKKTEWPQLSPHPYHNSVWSGVARPISSIEAALRNPATLAKMDKYEKKAFLAEYSALQKSLDPSPLVAEMVSAGLVTENQLDDITETATASAKTVKLLEIVRKHGNSRVFELFVKCIEDADEAQKYLADRLRGRLWFCDLKAVNDLFIHLTLGVFPMHV